MLFSLFAIPRFKNLAAAVCYFVSKKGVIFLGRKSHYISVDDLKIKDKIFLNALRCSGYASKEQCLKYISSNRLKNYVLEKVVDKCSVIINGKSETVYRFSDNGKEWVKENVSDLSDRNFYSSTGVEHDLRLMDKIQEIAEKIPYEEQLKFRTEIENRDLFKELCQNMEQGQYYLEQMQQHNISMPDFSYGTTFVEAVTMNYSGEVIESKEMSMEVFNGSLEFIK